MNDRSTIRQELVEYIRSLPNRSQLVISLQCEHGMNDAEMIAVTGLTGAEISGISTAFSAGVVVILSKGLDPPI